MKIDEIEEYDPEEYYGSFELERSEEYVIYLDLPAYIIEDLDITCFEGNCCNIENGKEYEDFSLTAVFQDDEYMYFESDDISVTLFNYFRTADIGKNISDVDFTIEHDFNNQRIVKILKKLGYSESEIKELISEDPPEVDWI